MAIFNQSFLKNHDLILSETSVSDRLGQTDLTNDEDREILAAHYRESISIAQEFNAPLLLGTPTLRTNQEQLAQAKINHNINALAGRFLKYIRAENDSWADNIFIGGIIGSKDGSSKKKPPLSTKQAISFHAWQIEQLEREEVDFFLAYAQTAVTEAVGISTVMAVTSTPYVVSFVINKDGKMPDGTPLHDAIAEIDSLGLSKPIGYIINCECPSTFRENEQPEIVMQRLIGIIANGSNLFNIENSDDARAATDSRQQWVSHLKSINHQYDVPIMGSNIGPQYLRYLALGMTRDSDEQKA